MNMKTGIENVCKLTKCKRWKTKQLNVNHQPKIKLYIAYIEFMESNKTQHFRSSAAGQGATSNIYFLTLSAPQAPSTSIYSRKISVSDFGVNCSFNGYSNWSCEIKYCPSAFKLTEQYEQVRHLRATSAH